MAKGYRQGRLGEEIKRIISDLLIKGLKDPKLSPMVSITDVEVTNDGSYATCYFTVLGMGSAEDNEAEIEETLQAFGRAKGFIRNEIGHKIKLRHTPELIFKVDRSMEYGRHISGIIDSLDIKHDEEEETENDE